MAGTGRTPGAWRWPAAFAALVIVLAAAGSEPAQVEPGGDAALFASCQRAAQELFDEYRNAEHTSVAVVCERPDGTVVDPKLWLPTAPAQPAPTPVMTVGHAGCVTGAGRPVAASTLTSVTATTASGEAVVYQRQRLDGSETVNSSGSPVLEFRPGDLAPGGIYRWRARVDDGAASPISGPDDEERGWSSWCEFTVSADAVDYRGLGDVSFEALRELGVRPDRSYTVGLSGRQQRLLRAGTDVGRTTRSMTLTGPRWTDLLAQLAESARIADETAADETAAEDDSALPDGAAYRALVDAISVKLGGPRHPHLL